jgi:DNA repair protein RecO (recombination protein O)
VSAPARSYKTRAIVLRARNLGEADKIFTLFTDARGKLDAVAKGVRRAKSQVAGRLEFASEAQLGMHRGRNLDIITSADITHSRFSSVTDPAAFATAHLLAELIDAFCEPDLAMSDVYALLEGALAALAGAAEPAALVPRFELRLLDALGFAPAGDACVRCGDSLAGRPAWADLESGGLACERCRPHRADALALGPDDVANFQGLGAARSGRGVRAVLNATAAAAKAIDAFVNYNLGKRPKSRTLLDDLAHLPAVREASQTANG